MVVTHGLCKNTATHSIGWVSQVTETSLASHFLPIPTLSQHWDLNLSGSSSGLTMTGVQARAGAWPARASLPIPFSSRTSILPNQDLTWVLLIPLAKDTPPARLGFSIDFIDIFIPQTLKTWPLLQMACVFSYMSSETENYFITTICNPSK